MQSQKFVLAFVVALFCLSLNSVMAQVLTEFQRGHYPERISHCGITVGPDGNLWFTGGGGDSRIGRITPTGVITEFRAGITPELNPFALQPVRMAISGLPNRRGNRIGRITPAGEVTEFSAGITAGANPRASRPVQTEMFWFYGTGNIEDRTNYARRRGHRVQHGDYSCGAAFWHNVRSGWQPVVH
jgi:hypothetical protein